jgi:IS30 family transposase
MVGKNHKSAVLVVTDRKSRFNKLRKLDGKHAKKVTRETAKALKGLPIKTMSNDRGQEFKTTRRSRKSKFTSAIHTRVIKEARMKTGLVPSGNTCRRKQT